MRMPSLLIAFCFLTGGLARAESPEDARRVVMSEASPSPLSGVIEETERRARKHDVTGRVFIYWGIVSLGAALIGLVLAAANPRDSGNHEAYSSGLGMVFFAGPVGVLQLGIGVPLWYAGKSESEIAASLRALDRAMARQP